MWKRWGSPFGAVRERSCPVCGKVFRLVNANQKYCSKACKRRAERLKARTGFAFPSTVVVERPVASDGLAAGEVRVSKSTVDADPVAGVNVDPLLSRAQLVERQGGVCPVCGRGLDLGVYDPFSVDYACPVWRIPLGEGGRAVNANRVLVHRGCAGSQ